MVRANKIIDNKRLQFINQGSCNVHPYLRDSGPELSLLTLGANPSQNINLGSCDLVFNQISDPDSHKISLTKALRICDRIKPSQKIINHPEKIFKTSRQPGLSSTQS